MRPHAKFLDCFPRVQRPGECLTCACVRAHAQENVLAFDENATVEAEWSPSKWMIATILHVIRSDIVTYEVRWIDGEQKHIPGTSIRHIQGRARGRRRSRFSVEDEAALPQWGSNS